MIYVRLYFVIFLNVAINSVDILDLRQMVEWKGQRFAFSIWKVRVFIVLLGWDNISLSSISAVSH